MASNFDPLIRMWLGENSLHFHSHSFKFEILGPEVGIEMVLQHRIQERLEDAKALKAQETSDTPYVLLRCHTRHSESVWIVVRVCSTIPEWQKENCQATSDRRCLPMTRWFQNGCAPAVILSCSLLGFLTEPHLLVVLRVRFRAEAVTELQQSNVWVTATRVKARNKQNKPEDNTDCTHRGSYNLGLVTAYTAILGLGFAACE